MLAEFLSYKEVSEEKTEKGSNIYFSYLLRDYLIEKCDSKQRNIGIAMKMILELI